MRGSRGPTRARRIYEVFAEAGVRYVGELTTSGAGLQTVRPVDQVLARPRHGTCQLPEDSPVFRSFPAGPGPGESPFDLRFTGRSPLLRLACA
jgi:hypothetical protein